MISIIILLLLLLLSLLLLFSLCMFAPSFALPICRSNFNIQIWLIQNAAWKSFRSINLVKKRKKRKGKQYLKIQKYMFNVCFNGDSVLSEKNILMLSSSRKLLSSGDQERCTVTSKRLSLAHTAQVTGYAFVGTFSKVSHVNSWKSTTCTLHGWVEKSHVETKGQRVK